MLNKSCLGKSYGPIAMEVTLDALQQYARAYNDYNPRYFEAAADGVIAPPMFNVVVTWLPLITALSDPELRADLLRLLHRRQQMEFFVPLRPGDRIAATATIRTIENVPTGESLTIELGASNQHHQLVSRTCFTALIRRRHSAAIETRRSAEIEPRPTPLVTVSQNVAPDQTVRYADASGDRNPIHLDEAVARMAGLPGIILQGLCTMAFTSKVLIDQLCGGAPERIRQLSVTFSRPVFPGDTITTQIWREDDRQTRFSFETCNQAGVAVISDGIAIIGAA